VEEAAITVAVDVAVITVAAEEDNQQQLLFPDRYPTNF